MGIRFHCPNGHKLNVKAFLAGKKGVCPDCGAKVRIPQESEPGLGGHDEEPDEGPFSQADVTAAIRSEVNQPTVAQPTPARPATVNVPPPPTPGTAQVIAVRPVVPTIPPTPQSALPAPVTFNPVMQAPALQSPVIPAPYVPAPAPAPVMPNPAMPMPHPGMRPNSPPPPPPPPGPRDPLTDNPLATWFVRPPSGGQFGPARGDVMRKWITEGRVTSDSLVWREGWADWLAATEVFPSLAKPVLPLISTAPAFNANSPSSRSSVAMATRSKGPSTGVVILIVLALVCAVLGAVLFVVLSGGLETT